MNNLSKLALAASFGLICAQPAFAQSAPAMQVMHEGRGHMDMGMMGHESSPFMALLKSANLTPTQHAQVRQILQSDRAQMKPLMEQFHALHEQIAAKLFSAGTVSASDLAPLTQKASRIQQQIDQNMVDTALAVRNVLTADQLSRLAQVHQQLQNLHEQIRNLMGSESEDSGEGSN